MASKTETEDKTKKSLYKVTNCDGTKISIKKIFCTEGISPLKNKNSKENKENICEITSHDKTNKNKTSRKKKRKNKKTTCNEASNKNEISSKETRTNENTNCDEVSKESEEPKVSIYEIRNCDGEEIVLNKLSISDVATSFQDKFLEKPQEPTYDIMEYDENKISNKEMTIYEIITYKDTDRKEVPIEEESSHEKTTCDEPNKSEIPVKEERESSHEKTTCVEVNKDEVSVKEELSHEKLTCDEVNKGEVSDKKESFVEKTTSDEANNGNIVTHLFTIKHKVLIGEAHPIYNLHIGDIILHAFKAEPEFIGQVDVTTGEQVTFEQMQKNSVKCALWLKKILKNCNETITICTCNSMKAYIPYLATLYLGAVVNPWEEKYLEDNIRILYFLSENIPDVIFVDDHNATRISDAAKFLNKFDSRINPVIVVFGEKEGFHSLRTILATEVDKSEIDGFSCNRLRNMYDIAVVMFSSNTTNYPGEAQIPYIAFVSPSNMEVPMMAYGEIGLWYGSLCWTHSLFLTVRAIISFTTALKCSRDKFDEEYLYQTIEKYKVTWIFLESSICEKMFLTDIMVKRYDVSSLKKFLFGDTPIEEGIHEDFIIYLSHVSVIQVYCDSAAGVIAFQRDSGNLRCSGYVSKNVQVAIVDINTRQVTDVNVRGEIWCKTPQMCAPYTLRPNNSMHNQFNDWYYTGDYGYYDEEGEIYIIDRVRHLIEYKNSIVSAADIEEMLLRNWNVAEAVVLPIPVANDNQHPAAFVRRMLGTQVTKEELMELVATNMNDCCKLRGGLYFVKDFPRLPNGKIDRQRVKYEAGWNAEHYFKVLTGLDEPKRSTDKFEMVIEKPGKETDKPAMETDKSGKEEDRPREEADKLRKETDKSDEKTDKHGKETDKSRKETGKSGEEINKPMKKTDKSGEKAGKSGKETDKSGMKMDKPEKKTNKSGKETNKPEIKSDKTGKETDKPGKKIDKKMFK